MSAVMFLLIMATSFQHVLSKIYDSNLTTFSGVYNTESRQCETQWGKVNIGENVHQFSYHGSTVLKCVEGGFEINERTSYVKIYGTQIPATNTKTNTKCGVFSYSATVHIGTFSEDVATLNLTVYKDKSSAVVCDLRKFYECLLVDEPRMTKCTYMTCTNLGAFSILRRDCEIDGKCYKVGYKIESGWFWWKKKCFCLSTGKMQC